MADVPTTFKFVALAASRYSSTCPALAAELISKAVLLANKGTLLDQQSRTALCPSCLTLVTPATSSVRTISRERLRAKRRRGREGRGRGKGRGACQFGRGGSSGSGSICVADWSSDGPVKKQLSKHYLMLHCKICHKSFVYDMRTQQDRSSKRNPSLPLSPLLPSSLPSSLPTTASPGPRAPSSSSITAPLTTTTHRHGTPTHTPTASITTTGTRTPSQEKRSGSINNRRLSKSSLRSRLEDSAVARVRMQQQLMASPSLKLFLDSTS